MMLMSSEKSFRALRNAIRDANGPVIPCLGMLLTDLTFIETASLSPTDDATIELLKRERRNAVLEVLLHPDMPHLAELDLDPTTQHLAEAINLLQMTEEEQHQRSLLVEPRPSLTNQHGDSQIRKAVRGFMERNPSVAAMARNLMESLLPR